MKRHYQDVADPRLFFLKDFQAKRLRVTYDDLAQQPQYKAACFFFFNRLYTTEDTAERDQAFKKIHGIARRWLGGDVVKSMEKLIELQDITIEMDNAIMLRLLQEEAPIAFDTETYERIYRECDNFNLRELQIELLDFTMRLVHKISHRFGIGMVLSGLHGACVLAGDTRMVDFLMDGYKAFRDQRNIEPLAQAMVHRETQRLLRIYDMPHTETW